MPITRVPTAVAAGYAGEAASGARAPVIQRHAPYFAQQAVSGAPSIIRASAVQTDNYAGHGNGPAYRPIIIGPDHSLTAHPIILAERPSVPKKASTQSGSSTSTYPLVYFKQPYSMDLQAPTYADVRAYMSALARR